MKKIVLKSLHLVNFKGIKDKELNFYDDVTNIIGENGSGKTTIFDAFVWLLFDYDSLGRSTQLANIRPLDENNNKINFIDCIVVGKFLIDDKELELKKVYKEKWVKKRGSFEKEFSGNETEYFINDLQVKSKEYTENINNIIDVETFKLITDPLYFNNLDWKKQREIIMKNVDEIQDNDIIMANENLKELSIDEDVENQKERAKQKINSFKKENTEFPIKINELNLILSKKREELSKIDLNEIEKDKKEIEVLEQKASEILQKRSEIKEKIKRSDMNVLIKKSKENEIEKEREKFKSSIHYKNNELKLEYERKSNHIALKRKELDHNKQSLKEIDNQLEHQRKIVKQFKTTLEETKNKTYDDSYQSNYCNYCNQAISLDMLARMKDKEVKRFEETKNKKINDLETTITHEIEKGKELKSKRENLYTLILNLSEELDTLTLNEPKYIVFDEEEFKQTSIYQQLLKELEEIKIVNNDELIEEVEELEGKIAQIDIILKGLKEKNSIQNKVDYLKQEIEETKSRINILENEHKAVVKEINKYQKIQYLCDEFMKQKILLVQEKVRELFNGIEFKMFELQVNGNLIETCELIYNGVPYKALNNARKINCGLKVIKVLSQLNNVTAPIFIDNRESVTEIEKMESQVINLIVPTTKINVDVEL